MTKRNKANIYSDVFENIDLDVAGVLRKCDNGRNYDTLPQKEKDKLWKSLFNLIITNNLTESTDENIQIVKVVFEVILSVLSFSENDLEKCKSLVEIVKFINSKEFLVSTPAIVNALSKINEYWMAKVQESDEIPGMEYFTLKHLLILCTGEKIIMSDVQRLSSIRKAMTAAPFEKTIPSIKPLLIKLVETASVVSSECGQRFIAQSLVLSQKLMMDIHKTIMLELGTCNKKKADNYGKVYVVAWHNASDELKPLLEKLCFQNLMEKFMKEQRTSLELSKGSQNILAVLEAWHSERSKKNPEFITMITNAYQPILWKYLQSGFNMYRCNAADVLFKAFPLQRSDDNAVEAEKLFNMQYEAMLSCLTDDCHIVRIIGIREVCNILSLYWNSFNSSQIQSLLKVITKENACDSSTAEVRRMVYIGFQSLVKSSLSCDYMKQILPLLGHNIHDVNQRVRIAFIQLLKCIKDKKDPSFKYSDVVSMGNIQYRLADDNATVGQWIVELLMKNYYHSKMAVVEWTKRFIYLIKTYRNSYRNFFFYSGRSLSFDDACTIIYEILTQLGMFVLSKSGSDKEDSENIIEKPVEKRRGNKKVPLSESNGRRDSTESADSSSSSKKCAFDDPEVVCGLFDIVTILWVLHDIQLNKPENEEMRFKLYETYIKYAQPFINYYKDSDLFLGIISLSGNIPASLLRNNSITLPGYCIKILKSCNLNREEEDREKIVCMLMALVKWGRGREIMELVTLWLDAAFETQNMNETILPRRRVRINETIQPNSVVAIHILDTLLKMEYAKLSILKKNYNELFQLWKFMSRIRQLIETRLELAEPFEDDLVSDDFLILCFRRYVKLIPLLKDEGNREESEDKENQTSKEEEESFVNRQKEMENLLEWAGDLFWPLLEMDDVEETELNLVVSLLEDILYVSDNMIIVHFVNHLFHFKLGHFVLKLLDTKHAIWFIKASTRIIAALNHSAKLLFNVSDDLKIFSTVVPSLMSHTLNALATHEFAPKEMEKIEEEMPSIRSNLGKVLATYQDNLKQTSNLKEKARQLKMVVGFFVDCIVHLIVRNLPKVGDEFGTIPEYASPNQLPLVANTLINLFHNKKTWSSLFIHLLSGKLSKEENVKTNLAAILLLNMYAVGDKKASRDEINKLLTFARKTLTEIKKSSAVSQQINDLFLDVVNEKAVDKSKTDTGDSQPMSIDFQENTSKEVLVHCNETPEESRSHLMTSDCEKHSDEYFVNYALDLITDIEKVLKSQTAEGDENS